MDEEGLGLDGSSSRLGRGLFGRRLHADSPAHATVQKILARVRPEEEGLVFDSADQRADSDRAVSFAHRLLAIVLEELIRHFHLGTDISTIRALFRTSWPIAATGISSPDR